MANFEYGVNRSVLDILREFGKAPPTASVVHPEPRIATPTGEYRGAHNVNFDKVIPQAPTWNSNVQWGEQPQMYSFDQVGHNIADIPAAPNSPVKQTKKRPTTGAANILEKLLSPVTEAEKQKYYAGGGVQTIRGTMDPKERISVGYFNPTTEGEYSSMREAIEGTAFPQAAASREIDMDLLKEQERTRALLGATRMDTASREKIANTEIQQYLEALKGLPTDATMKPMSSSFSGSAYDPVGVAFGRSATAQGQINDIKLGTQDENEEEKKRKEREIVSFSN